MIKEKSRYWTLLSPLIRRSIEKRYSKVLADYALKNGKENYLRILGEAGDIGENNPLEPAAHAAFLFIGCWLGTGKLISPSGMANVMGDVIRELRPLFLLTNLNSKKTQRRWQERLQSYAGWAAANEAQAPDAWHIEPVSGDGIVFTMDRCPIVRYCREAGIAQILPALEQAAGALISQLHGTLRSENSLYTGGDCGKYLILGDKVGKADS